MEEPSPRSSRLALAGALLAVTVVGGAGFLLGRGTSERPPAPAPPPVAAPAPKSVPEPVLSGALGRAGLVELAAAAADAAAAGNAPGPEIGQADGRRFELRLPFGCTGPAPEESGGPMRWRYDPKVEALRIFIDPLRWAAEDWWPAEAAGGVEAVEGFWIDRPWTSSEACPVASGQPAAAGAEPVTLPGQTLALGQIFVADGGRGGRRDGKPYEAVVRIPQDQLDASAGFRLRLSGRIVRAPGGGPVRCRQPGPEQRPVCLISVVTDEVAVENPITGETLATWSLASREAPDA